MNRWQDVLELDVQVAIYAADAGLWDIAKWNATDKWAGGGADNGLMWTSIYDRVTAVSIDRGRSDLCGFADAGTATIDIINDDGWASGLPAAAGMAPLVPGRQVKIAVRPAGSYAADPWTTLWIGYVDAVSAPWRTAKTSMATLRCADALARLSRLDPVKTAMPREPLNTRLNRILDMASWTGGRNLATGSSFYARASTADRNLLNEAQITAFSAMQFLYADRSNVISTKVMTAFHPSNLFHITNRPGLNNINGTWCPNLPIDFRGASREGIYNRIHLQYPEGALTTFSSAQSQAAYGDRSYSRTDLMADNPAYVTDLGNMLISHYAWQRPGNVTYDIDLPSGINLGPALNLAAIELQDQVYTDLTLDPVDGPPWTTTGTNTVRYVLVGVTHNITDRTWTASLTLDQPSGVQPAQLTDHEEEMAWH